METTELKIIFPENYERPILPFFREWVTALESGAYQQGGGWLLRTNGSYCCLGVLSKIQGRLTAAGVDGVKTARLFDSVLSEDNPCYSQIGEDGTFPHKVEVIHVSSGRSYSSLAKLNDSGNATFKDIAYIIKQVWRES